MKKQLAIIVLMLALLLAACSTTTSTKDRPDTGKSFFKTDNTTQSENASDGSVPEVQHTGVKLSGEITGASIFSEGLAFVCVDGNKETTHCITKDGYIVFTLNQKLVVNGNIDEQFVNGLAAVGEGLCDVSGKITLPEDVGATKFFSTALNEGYIIAEKVTSDYASSKSELGILDLDFNWVVAPSESLYQTCSDEDGYLTIDPFSAFCSNGVLFMYKAGKYLDLKTGTIHDTAPAQPTSDAWSCHYFNNSFYDKEAYFYIPSSDSEHTITLDLTDHPNIHLPGSAFINGKAAIAFNNNEANTSFFTLIDESGNYLFDPVQSTQNEISNAYYDGEYILVTNRDGSQIELECYDSNGVLLGTLNTEDLPYMGYTAEFSDGVILIRGGKNSSHKCYYFTPSFEPLF